jgi:hypothetical protein
VSNAVSTTYDFAAEGNFKEAGYLLFESDGHSEISTKEHNEKSADSAMKVSPVPVPTAFWLFGTALIGFVGLSRRTSLS